MFDHYAKCCVTLNVSSFVDNFRNDIVVVCSSHGEDDHFTVLVGSVLLMPTKVTDESYAGSELLVTLRTQQQTFV